MHRTIRRTAHHVPMTSLRPFAPFPDPESGDEGGSGKPPEGDPKPDGDISELPEWARTALTKANGEAAKYRTQVRELEPLAQKAREADEASKSEAEKANERATAAETKAQEAEARALRLEVAAEKGLTKAQAKRLVGATREDLEADADELLADFGTGDEPKTPPIPGKPTERMRGGGRPDAEPEPDIRKAVDAIPRGGF